MARTNQRAKNVAWIYKIEGNKKTYVGQCKEKYFSTRKKNHKAQFRRWLNGDKKYCSAFKCLSDEKVKFTILEEISYCGRWQGNKQLKEKLATKERFWRKKLNAVNKNTPGRQKQERDATSYVCICGEKLKYSSKWGHLNSLNHHRRIKS